MDLYDRITQLLNEQGITRKKMSKDIGVSYDTLNALFKRRTERVRLELIQSIARYLNTTVDFLAFGEEHHPTLKDTLDNIYEGLSDDLKNELVNYARYLQNKNN